MPADEEQKKSQEETPEAEGETMKMPRYRGKGEDKTVASSDKLKMEDEGETVLKPPHPEAAKEDDDGATVAMPDYEPDQPQQPPADDDDEGRTKYMPSPPSEAGETATGTDPTRVTAPSGPTRLSDPNLDQTTPDPTIASSPKPDEAAPDPTAVSPDKSRPQVEKPTKPSPAPDETKPGSDPKATMADKGQGKILHGRYQITKILGRGGFGAAYLADDTKLGRPCVVKQMLIPKGAPKDQIALYQANFQREARLLAELNNPGHPNIPEIYDYFSDEGGNYLVMKFIQGSSLADVIKESEGGIPWREAVRYMVAMSDALSYMHEHGQEPKMHRDIKPGNILLGDDHRVWLVDFGLAKADPVQDSGNVEASMAAGSLGYAPLEQWLGEAAPASDVYALGATLHYLVTGINPAQAFGGKFNITKLKELQGVFTPIRKADKNLPQALEKSIERATAVEPEQRLTAEQFKKELEALISPAQAAALYTFKSGASAKTVHELADLCEKHRQEAQKYLYNGDFQRWFTLINRNDLAQAAEQAIKQGKNQRDGLERFLKLLIPNLAIRRLRRAGWRLTRAVVVAGLIVAVTLALMAVGGSFVAKSFIQQSISSYEWDFNALNLGAENSLTEASLNENAQQIAGAYFDDLQLDIQPPDRVDINATWNNIDLNIPVGVQLQEGKPQLSLSQINQIPLPFIGNNISQGLNDGIEAAFQQSPVDFSAMQVNDETIMVEVEESRQSGRPALPTPTPLPTATPSPTPIPTPTPTPEGLALVTIFNESGRDIILDIEGEIIEMAANDSKAIEKPPGTYSYIVTYKDSGAVGAEGEKTWTVQTYKWRIGN